MSRNGRHDGQPGMRMPPGMLIPQQVGVQQQIVKTDLAESVVYGFVAGGQPLLLLYAGMTKLEKAALMMAAALVPDNGILEVPAEAVKLAQAVLAECDKAQRPPAPATIEGA